MRKADLVQIIAKETGLQKAEISRILESYFSYVKSSLASGEPVFVRGFGSFILKTRAAKIGRDIKRGVSVPIPEYLIPAFKPALEFKLEVRAASTKH